VLAWDDEGELLATASKKGTVVRVHAVGGSVLGLIRLVQTELLPPHLHKRLPNSRPKQPPASQAPCAVPRCAVQSKQMRRSDDKALEFRRGSTPATITCLAFSPSGVYPRLLCAASDHGTIHIFRLQGPGWVGLQPASQPASHLLPPCLQFLNTLLCHWVKSSSSPRQPVLITTRPVLAGTQRQQQPRRC
jgi:hypothetical protein